MVTHNKEKDFWDRFVAVSSKDMNLTKAHVKYLESRLLDFAHEANKVEIDNKTNPNFKNLPEADISDMESFLEEIRLALPVLGVDFFPTKKVQRKTVGTSAQMEVVPKDQAFFILKNAKAGIDARAAEIDGEFVVFASSQGNLKEKASFMDSASKTVRDRLLDVGGAEKISGDHFVIRQDVSFKSPSGAAVFLYGTSRNGRTDWLVEGESMTYADWKDREITEAIGSD